MLRRTLLQTATASALAAGLPTVGIASPSRTPRLWRLAVVPQLTPVEMTRAWSPIVQAWTQAGLPCELVVHPSIASFEPEFLKGQADVVFLNPYHMVMARRAHRYEPVLRDLRPLQGVLVVRQDSPWHSIAQLASQRISFPAPNAFAASLYVRAVLERQHQLRYDTHYAMNHRNAIRQVLAGDSAAAGIVRSTLEMEPPDVQQNLRVIYTTPALSPHPLAVHPRVPVAMRQILTNTLRALAQDDSRKPLMAAIQMPNPIKASYASDYAPLERLNIEKYLVSD